MIIHRREHLCKGRKRMTFIELIKHEIALRETALSKRNSLQRAEMPVNCWVHRQFTSLCSKGKVRNTGLHSQNTSRRMQKRPKWSLFLLIYWRIFSKALQWYANTLIPHTIRLLPQTTKLTAVASCSHVTEGEDEERTSFTPWCPRLVTVYGFTVRETFTSHVAMFLVEYLILTAELRL